MDDLTGSVERITYYNPENGYTVLRLRPEKVSWRRQLPGQSQEGLVTVVGNLPEVSPGEHLGGRWSTHPRHGQQFQAEDRGKAALTALFEEVRTADTPVMVQRIVDDIDDIVRKVRFDGWQATAAGEREVRKALRRTLFKYKLHTDLELFEKAYGYVREYY